MFHLSLEFLPSLMFEGQFRSPYHQILNYVENTCSYKHGSLSKSCSYNNKSFSLFQMRTNKDKKVLLNCVKMSANLHPSSIFEG
jgi:hypothetical protein